MVEHAEYGEVIQLQGDKRDAIRNFLVEVGIATSESVKVGSNCGAHWGHGSHSPVGLLFPETVL